MRGLFENILFERAVGTSNHKKVTNYVKKDLMQEGYDITTFPFSCLVWEKQPSFIHLGNKKFEIFVSPYSKGVNGKGVLQLIATREQLKNEDIEGKIVVLDGELTKEALSPKNYPFYYPDEHKDIIDTLEAKKPLAILAFTGKDTMSGLHPYPLFDDGNFIIPSCYSTKEILENEIQPYINKEVEIEIHSGTKETISEQIVGRKQVNNSKGRIVLCCHLDTKYDTKGALDNASGLVCVLELAKRLQLKHYDIDIVPFASEEYFGANGEVEYINEVIKTKENIKLLVNFDGVGHIGSKVDISLYNINEKWSKIIEKIINESKQTQKGQEWYAGDHVPFVFQQIPCLAIASSDMWMGGLEHTHTPNDLLEDIDFKLLEEAIQIIEKIIKEIDKKEL